ncbi:MAG: helix-turn-helix transcriptional regulator [Vallitaleaceae bacterium]|nr:helix-turn-helix transcriptional regulator [Vallitaleaceae bacterium]
MKLIKAGFQGTHDKNFIVSRPNGYPHFLFLLIKTPALFTLNKEVFEAQSDSVILYEPYVPHHYAAHKGIYVNDWLHFSLDDAEQKEFLLDLPIPLNTLIHLRDISFISTMVHLISDEYYSLNPLREKIMISLLQSLLSKLGEQTNVTLTPMELTPHFSALLSLRKEIYSNPHIHWTVALLAEKLNLCPTYFQKIYRSNFHISCMADVILARISYAKELLSKSDLSLREISDACGYHSDVHFMRQFKKNIGLTPSQYRFKQQVNIVSN